MKKLLCVLWSAHLLAACGAGSGEGLDGQGQPLSESGDEQVPDDTQNEDPGLPAGGASLADIQEEIFSPICSVCHAGSGAPRGLRLDSEENSFNFLVGVNADEVPALLRVNPGEPDDSYLVQKIEGAPGIVGSQMPLGGPALSDQQIVLVRSWIESGAFRNAQSISQKNSVPATVSLVGIRKQSSEVIFDFYFSETLDLSVSSLSVPLLELVDGDDRLFVQRDDFNYQYRDNTLTVQYWGNPQPYSQLNITLNSPGGSEISDINGFRVDGDSNKIEGGVFNYEYSF